MLKEQNNMNRIIELLEEKNNHLEMFLYASDRERKSFKARNFDNVEVLYQTREEILKNIQSIDGRIESYSQHVDSESITLHERKKIEEEMERRQRLVNKIMSQDLVIISCIESEKSAMIKKVSSMKSGRRLLRAYKSLPDIID